MAGSRQGGAGGSSSVTLLALRSLSGPPRPKARPRASSPSGQIPGRGNAFQSFLQQISKRTTQSRAAAGGGGVTSPRSPLLVPCSASVSLWYPAFSQRHPTVFPASTLIKMSSKQLCIFTHEHCLLGTARIFFYWAFSIMDNKFIQTFSPSKNMMKYKTGTLLCNKKDKIQYDSDSGSNSNHISTHTSREL